MTTNKQMKPRTRWDKYRCEWHIGGNYTNNAAIILKNVPQRRLLQRTVKLIKEDCRLDQILRFRQDWVIFDSRGRTDLEKTKENVQHQLAQIKQQICELGFSSQFLDKFITSGFEQAYPPKPKSSKRTRLVKDLGDLGLEKL